MKKLMKLKIEFLQTIADNLAKRMKETESDMEFQMLFNIGMSFNMWCVRREIFLN